MKETKSFNVSPYEENDEIRIRSDFGWEFQSSQEIFNKDSGLERRGDTIYSVTTTTNYVKLVFQRDTDIPNLSEIKKLEQEFDSLPSHVYDKYVPSLDLLWFLLLVFLPLISWIFFIYLRVKNKKHNKFAKKTNEYSSKRQSELRHRARALLR
jgi:hypothetical protein